jgi:hypothetical protein
MVIFNSYVKLPEGKNDGCLLFFAVLDCWRVPTLADVLFTRKSCLSSSWVDSWVVYALISIYSVYYYYISIYSVYYYYFYYKFGSIFPIITYLLFTTHGLPTDHSHNPGE